MSGFSLHAGEVIEIGIGNTYTRLAESLAPLSKDGAGVPKVHDWQCFVDVDVDHHQKIKKSCFCFKYFWRVFFVFGCPLRKFELFSISNSAADLCTL